MAGRPRSVSTSDSTAPELPIYRMPGHLVRRLQQIAVALFAAEIGTLDLTPVQYGALVAVAGAPDIDQATLAARIAYDRATIGGVVDRLEAKGWITRSGDPRDRRVRRLRVTAAGARVIAKVTPAVERVQDRLCAPLSAAERRTFERLCAKLVSRPE